LVLVAPRQWDEGLAGSIVEERAAMPGAMLPILHALQHEFGYIDERAIPVVADVLNVSRAEVVGVIHFYHDFKTEPGGRHLLQVCRAEACQSMGGDAVIEHIERRLGVKTGETTADRSVSLEPVFCLGNCALSPALMLDGRLYGRVTAAKADSLLAAAR
jgi:formate dehydrogenase subunit gamma